MTGNTTAGTRPNVIWIFGDQHRGQALSSEGDPNVNTPNIDLLGHWGEGRLQGIAGSPICSPYRGSLLTSQYPHRCVPGHDTPLPEGASTVATVFHGQGYRTAYFGKWHVDGAANRPKGTHAGRQIVAPERRGDFEFWLGYENNTMPWECWVHGHDESRVAIEQYHLPGYETDALTDLFIDYLNRRAGERGKGADAQPFFAVLSVDPPHSPYAAPPEWMARHNPGEVRLRPNVPPVQRVITEARRSIAGYSAMVENLDWNVGRIVQALEKTGLYEETYIVFFSDHGDMLGSHGHVLKCVPWEESIRIPFVVSGRDKKPFFATGFRETPPFVNHVDVAPTTLGLCGIDKPDWMVGVDYSGYVDSGRPRPVDEPDSAFLQLVDSGSNIDRDRPWRGVITRDGWKYAVLEGQPWVMYNLNEDPYERVNLAILGYFKAERRRLQDLLADWMDRTGDRFKLPEI